MSGLTIRLADDEPAPLRIPVNGTILVRCGTLGHPDGEHTHDSSERCRLCARRRGPCRSCGADVDHPGIRDCAAALIDEAAGAPNGRLIVAECIRLARLLLSRNRQYGDSVFDPLRVFSQADATEQLKVRLDDKLSRLVRGEAAGEDVMLDLIGYWVLLRAVEGCR